MEAEQSVELTGTNRSNPPDPSVGCGQPDTARVQRPAPAPIERSPPGCAAAARTLLPRTLRPRTLRPVTFTNPALPQAPAGASMGPAGWPAWAVGQPDGPRPRQGSATGQTGSPRAKRGVGQPGGHSEGQNTRSHPELGRENPQRRWYCRSSGGRAGRRQARQPPAPRPAADHDQPPNHAKTPQRPPGKGAGPHTHPPRGGAAR